MYLNNCQVNKQRGQAMAEFSITLPFLAPLILVLIMMLLQWTSVYKEKITLNAATFDAARAGALNNGDMAKMEDALAQGMMPLFMEDEIGAIEIGKAYAKAKLAVTAGASITILNPTPNVFEKHKVRRRYGRSTYINEIPNDNLMYRKPVEKHINDNVYMNVQDANLLKIEVQWCKRLEVPIANWAIGKILTLTDVSIDPLDPKFVLYTPGTHQLRCSALGMTTSQNGEVTFNDYYMSVKSYALIRMQTPFRM